MLRLTPVPPVVWVNWTYQDDYEHLALIEELLYFDLLSTRPLRLTVEKAGMVFGGSLNIVTMRHWSRIFEYPWALRAADPAPGDVILDAGGGEGLLQYSLAARCASVVNVDCSEAYIGKVLAGPLYGYFRNIRYEVGDIRKLEYPNDHFDKVFCVSVLEHMTTQTDVMAAAKEMYRVLKPGGHLVLTVDVAPFARWSHSIDDKFLQELFGQWGVIVPPRPEEALIGTCDEAEPRPGEPTQVAMTVFCAKIIKQKSSSNSA